MHISRWFLLGRVSENPLEKRILTWMSCTFFCISKWLWSSQYFLHNMPICKTGWSKKSPRSQQEWVTFMARICCTREMYQQFKQINIARRWSVAIVKRREKLELVMVKKKKGGEFQLSWFQEKGLLLCCFYTSNGRGWMRVLFSILAQIPSDGMFWNVGSIRKSISSVSTC